jgi:membrane protease YdiL (CAAX protease family)
VAGFIVLAWTGSISEEIFVRGHFFNTLHGLLGRSRAGLYATAVITAVLFAMGHGYQGWVGMLDTGFYGGLILTLLYIWRGRLTSCIVAHAMWNTLAPLGVYLLY